jgi:hypothetical protein
MLKSFIRIPEEEGREMERWMLEHFSQPQQVPVDILLLILYRIHLLEQKIDAIEEQTRTHWVK